MDEADQGSNLEESSNDPSLDADDPLLQAIQDLKRRLAETDQETLGFDSAHIVHAALPQMLAKLQSFVVRTKEQILNEQRQIEDRISTLGLPAEIQSRQLLAAERLKTQKEDALVAEANKMMAEIVNVSRRLMGDGTTSLFVDRYGGEKIG